MVKITYESILARAISDCSKDRNDALDSVEEYHRMGKSAESDFWYFKVYKPLQEELDGLKRLYQIETGRPFDYREED